ncbi:sugar phosphate isomerase/epimerase family protein [Cystobacter fuscus]|uniref:sugar phosphate isomerase/epimerase family protein n=1 Tax=Cystobacter fuscus TaxID=43 RepID=UPI0037C0AD43
MLNARYPDIGFSTNVFDNPPDVVDSVARLAPHFHSIELELGERAETAVMEIPEGEYTRIVGALRELIATHGTDLSVHAPYLAHNLASDDAGTREAAVERLMKACRVARDLGSRRVTCHPGIIGKRTPEKTIEPLLRSLEKCMPTLSDWGITLCLENMGADRPTYIVYTPEQQAEICRKSGARIAMDVIHLASVVPQGEEFERAVEIVAPFVSNMHVADMNIPDHVHIPIGAGNLPLQEILARFKQLGYAGPAIVEEFGGPYTTEVFLDRAIAFRKSLQSGPV